MVSSVQQCPRNNRGKASSTMRLESLPSSISSVSYSSDFSTPSYIVINLEFLVICLYNFCVFLECVPFSQGLCMQTLMDTIFIHYYVYKIDKNFP